MCLKPIPFYFKHVAAGKDVSDKSILELSNANCSQKGQDVKESAEVMVASVPTDETVVKMHTLKDAAANYAETKESNPGSLALT